MDINGKVVHVLSNQFNQAGNYNMDMNTVNITSGIYFARIIANDETKTIKIIIAK